MRSTTALLAAIISVAATTVSAVGSTSTIHGSACDVANVVRVNDNCVSGAPHFDAEGMVCANDGTATEAYCSYDVGTSACAYCKA